MRLEGSTCLFCQSMRSNHKMAYQGGRARCKVMAESFIIICCTCCSGVPAICWAFAVSYLHWCTSWYKEKFLFQLQTLKNADWKMGEEVLAGFQSQEVWVMSTLCGFYEGLLEIYHDLVWDLLVGSNLPSANPCPRQCVYCTLHRIMYWASHST